MYHEKYGAVKFSEGLGIFDQHYGYPQIDNQEIYDGPTGKVIDIQGIQAHAGKHFFVPDGKEFSIDIDQHPYLHIAIKAEPGTSTCLFLQVHEREHDWKRRFVVIGKTPQGDPWRYHLMNNHFTIRDDDKWHSYLIYMRFIRKYIHDAGSIRRIQFYNWTGSDTDTHAFHFNNLRMDKDLDWAPNIQHHASVLQKVGITDLSTLGKLSIPSGNVTPQSGVLIPPSPSHVPDDIIGQRTTFHSADCIIQESTGAYRLEKIGGTTHFLKALNFMGSATFSIQHLLAQTAICANPLTPTHLLEIPVAYWAANEIDIPDNTKIVFLQPHHWLMMLANKITIGNNVEMTWEKVEKEVEITEGEVEEENSSQPKQIDKLDPPPTSLYMSGTNGCNGDHGDSERSGRGPDGDDGPEIEVWTLDINKLPSVHIGGQKGCQGGKGQNGQDGQDGAKGRSWIPGGLGWCKHGPGNGGKGGDGGKGAEGGQGGDGGHGGRFNVFAPANALLAIGQVGYYIDTTGGDGGEGGDGGDGGEGGNGGKAGNNRSWPSCPTKFGQNGGCGLKGDNGDKGDYGGVGDHFEDAEKKIPITADEFHEAFNKPAIIDLSAEYACSGDVVTAIGRHFTNTDKVFVDDIEASATVFSDTLLSFTVPQTIGGRQKAVVVKQQDGTLSNRGTLHIVPKLLYALQNGKKSTDRPVARFTPGSNVTLVGTGFAPDAQVRVESAYVSGADVQYVDPTKLTFKLIRPVSTPENRDGEPVDIKIILPDGSESNAITIILDTYVIAVFGDSIQWGQGLREDLKFHSLVENRIKATNGDMGVYKTVLAHSGATIGVGNNTQLPPVNGEVPTSFPTILQQIDAYPHDPASVDLVLLDGGINDITVEEIVSPIATSNLSNFAQQYCYTDMKVLLTKVAEQFPNARIIVTGYYSIITDDSDLSPLFLLLSGLGMIVGGLAGAIVGGAISVAQKDVMVSRSNTFATEANQKLQNAVNDINATLTDGTKVYFARPNFSSRNAIFAPDTWLWGIDMDFSPEDIQQIGGVAPTRERVCQSVAASDPSRTNLGKCKIASIGHPNVAGAKEYARVILELVS